jgi:hypothetical protein
MFDVTDQMITVHCAFVREKEKEGNIRVRASAI